MTIVEKTSRNNFPDPHTYIYAYIWMTLELIFNNISLLFSLINMYKSFFDSVEK